MFRRISAALAVALALLCGLCAASAAAAAIQPPDEEITISFPEPKGPPFLLRIYPDRGVGVLILQRGGYHARQGHNGTVNMAFKVSQAPLPAELSADIGPFGSIVGRFVATEPPKRGKVRKGCRGPAPVFEEGEFRGRVEIDGLNGFLRTRASSGIASVQRLSRLQCVKGAVTDPSPGPGLFSYVETGVGGFFNSTETLFEASKEGSKRNLLFAATAGENAPGTTTFRAAAFEWLPGHVAAARVVEAISRDPKDLVVGMPEETPRSLVVSPPFPFTGSGRFRRADLSFRGNLRLTFPGGLRVRLTGAGVEAGLCIYTAKMVEQNCTG